MGLHTLLLKWDANFYIFSNKDLLDKFFDFCREYRQEIPHQKMAEILREYADRLDEWKILAELRKYEEDIIS